MPRAVCLRTSASPCTVQYTHASRRSGDIFTPVIVTRPTRGSLRPRAKSSASFCCSRCPTRSGRLCVVTGGPPRGGTRGPLPPLPVAPPGGDLADDRPLRLKRPRPRNDERESDDPNDHVHPSLRRMPERPRREKRSSALSAAAEPLT